MTQELLHIIHVTSELAPIAKVGGLGDVVYGLSRAIAAEGHKVTVILPFYKAIDFAEVHSLKKLKPLGKVAVWSGRVDGISVIFLKPPGMFTHHRIYGQKNETEEYIAFCKTAKLFISTRTKGPSIVHVHDWLTASYCLFNDNDHPMVGTIHNMAYQGVYPLKKLKKYAIPNDETREVLDPRNKRCINLLKGLIVKCDRVNTVSPTYAREIMHAPEGCGLQKVLRKHRSKYSGILNGIDTDYWNPRTDKYLAKKYDASTIEKRDINKQALKNTLGLRNSDQPLIGIVSRLAEQKGLHFIEHAVEYSSHYDAQIVLIGTSYDKKTTRRFEKLARLHENNEDVSLHLCYDNPLSHLLFASADLMLIPSLFEPCGLTQLIALRYGALPLVRKVGGLADTVTDVTKKKGNGFSFNKPTITAFDRALQRAIRYWYEHPKEWKKLQLRAMNKDYSWDLAAESYLDLYRSIW